MDMWKANNNDIVCHNRLRAVSLGEEERDAISKITAANSDSDFSNQPSLNNSFENDTAAGNNNDNSFCLKSYIVNIAANEPVNMKKERQGHDDVSEARNPNMAMSWKERQNDYSFMKR